MKERNNKNITIIMKQMLLLLLAVTASLSALCQTSDDNYTPIVREGSEWVYYSISDRNTYKYKITGDSVVNGIQYKKLMRTGNHEMDNEDEWSYMTTTHCLLREDNKRVYGWPVETAHYIINKLRGEIFNEETGEDFLYDFNDLEQFYHDWADYYNYYDETIPDQLVSEITDTCLLVDRKCYRIGYGIGHNLVEGIGGYKNKNNDLVRRAWRLTGGASGHHLVSMKNAAGEFEYFDSDLYSKMLREQHDTNNDNMVDVTDLNIVCNDVLGIGQEKQGGYLYGSITEDNEFDVEDINSVVNYLLGKIKSPMEK